METEFLEAVLVVCVFKFGMLLGRLREWMMEFCGGVDGGRRHSRSLCTIIAVCCVAEWWMGKRWRCTCYWDYLR